MWSFNFLRSPFGVPIVKCEYSHLLSFRDFLLYYGKLSQSFRVGLGSGFVRR